jgi:hypothetical protein
MSNPIGSAGASNQQHPRVPQTAPLRQESESLRLPPLQIVSEAGRTLESVIMDIHFLGKIATLRQVAHPIKSERSRRRGCIIAVEGDREAPINPVVGSLVEILRKTGEFDVKVMEGPRHPEGKVTFEHYIEEVRKWHAKAPRLCKLLDWHDTDRNNQVLLKSDDSSSKMDVDVAPSTHQPDPKQKEEPPGSATSHTPISTAGGEASAKKIPLLIIPSYLVGASNSWAAALPVVDDYSVFNHWQWVATLWRGIPGPDFTLYVTGEVHSRTRTSSSSSDAPEQPPQHPRFGPLRTADAWSPKASVEFKEEHGTIIIHKEKQTLDPSAIRRAAFEIGEWARSAAGQGK